jgi:hypothetical protein
MKSFNIFFVFFSFLTILSLSLSCSSTNTATNITTSTKDVTDSLPLAFLGTMTSGSMGNPNAEIYLDTTLPESLSQILVYQIEKIDKESAKKIASNLGFYGELRLPTKTYEPFVTTNNGFVIEISQNGRFIMRQSQRNMSSPIILPSEEECIDIAKKYLQSYGVYPDDVVQITSGVSSDIANINTASSQTPIYQPTSFMVSFISAINGFERYSSSASVTLGDQGKVIQLTVYNPTVKDYGTTTLKTPEMALNTLKSYLTTPSFNPPEAEECAVNWKSFQKLSITKVSLKYYSADNSGYMQPIWVFQGDVQVGLKDLNTEKFVGCVDAVDHQKP